MKANSKTKFYNQISAQVLAVFQYVLQPIYEYSLYCLHKSNYCLFQISSLDLN